MIWTDDEEIVKFEESLTEDEAKMFVPYIMMFHVVKLSLKRAIELLKINDIKFDG